MNPPSAPIIIDIAAKIVISGCFIVLSNMIGAIFWTVARIVLIFQVRPSITWGSQKCRGAAPIFIIRARVTIVLWAGVHVNRVVGAIKIGIIKSADAITWVRKYFNIASFVILFF